MFPLASKKRGFNAICLNANTPAEIAGKRQDGAPRKFHRQRDGGVPDVLSRQTLLASLKTKHCIDLTVSPPSTGALQVRPRGRSMRRRRQVTLDSTVVLQESALFFSRLPHISFVPPWGPLALSFSRSVFSPVRTRQKRRINSEILDARASM